MSEEYTNNEEYAGATEDFADPQTEETQETMEDTEETTGESGATQEDGSAGVADQQVQSQEANAAFARMRRELEARDKWVAENFGASHGIYTFEQYTQAVESTKQRQQQQAYEQQRQELVDEGYDLDVINRIMSMHPEFQAVKQQNAMLQQQLGQQKLSAGIVNDFKHLKAKYGDMIPDSEEDAGAIVSKLDDKTFGLMKQGMPLKAAWLLANEDKILEATQTKAQQSTMRKINSKAHLATEKGGGADFGADVEISPDKMRVWKMMGYSEKEARQKELKYAKMRGK